MITPEETRRLALVKYYLSTAGYQLSQAEPLSSVALLLFHDATELFLQLAAEHLDAKTKPRTEFLAYWDVIDAALKHGALPKREAMKRMNAARVALKHHGTLPARGVLNDLKGMVDEFFEEATPLVFGVALDSISLTDLVACDEARDLLKRAERAQSTGNIGDGLIACAESFDALTTDYQRRKLEQFDRYPFYPEDPMKFWSSSVMQLAWQDEGREVAMLAESVEALRSTLKLLILGLDYRKYSYFRLLTPIVFHRPGVAGRSLQMKGLPRGMQVSAEHLSFCMGFVIESALRLQQSEYDPCKPGE